MLLTTPAVFFQCRKNPAFSALFATLIAAPDEIPTEIPSVFAESLAVS